MIFSICTDIKDHILYMVYVYIYTPSSHLYILLVKEVLAQVYIRHSNIYNEATSTLWWYIVKSRARKLKSLKQILQS